MEIQKLNALQLELLKVYSFQKVAFFLCHTF